MMAGDFSGGVSEDQVLQAIEEALVGTSFEVDRSGAGSADEQYGVFDLMVKLKGSKGRLVVGYFDGTSFAYETNIGIAAKKIAKTINGMDVGGATIRVLGAEYALIDNASGDQYWTLNHNLSYDDLVPDNSEEADSEMTDYVGLVEFVLE